MRRTVVALAGAAAVLLATTSAAFADNWRQAGGHSIDTSDYNNLGVRGQISAVTLPQVTTDGAASAFWVGEVLADNAFYQAGSVVNWGGCGNTCFQFFAEVLDAHNNPVLAWSRGSNNANHMYGFMVQNISPGINDWFAAFDGVRAMGTDYYSTAVNSGSNTPYAISELAITGSTVPDWHDYMGYANFFSPALQTLFCGTQCVWWDTYHAQIEYPYNWHCPPINVVKSSYQVFSAGAPGLDRYPCGQGLLW